MIHVKHVDIRNFRRLAKAEVELAPKMNLLFGDNGAGKTSFVEALSLAARGCGAQTRFRELRGPNGRVWSVSAQVMGRTGDLAPRLHRVAYESGQRIQKINGMPAHNSELARSLPMAALGPNQHGVVNEGAAARFRWIDWAMFHVEPSFLETWRNYRRALKQRNTLLRVGQGGQSLRAWSEEAAHFGEQLTALRRNFFSRCKAMLETELANLQSSGRWEVDFNVGWDKDIDLQSALRRNELTDSRAGTTRQGPHRADLLFMRNGTAARRHVSRGEEKMSAVALILVMIAQVRLVTGTMPVLLVDDLSAELSVSAQERVLKKLASLDGQVVVTAHEPFSKAGTQWFRTMFHVEHGAIRRCDKPL